jgi:hypothetical protein
MGFFATLGDFFAVAGRWIWGLGARYIPRIVAQTLVMFGLTIAIRNYGVPEVRDLISAHFTGLSPVAGQLIGYLKIDIAISIILSACAIKLGSSIKLAKKP